MTNYPSDPRTSLTAVRVDDLGRVLCHSKKTNGEPCMGPAMRGQRVCKVHGGSAPQAKAKARMRLMELVDPAIVTLAREMAQADTSVDRQRAANSILDRAGFARVTHMEHHDARDLLLARLLELRETMEAEAASEPD